MQGFAVAKYDLVNFCEADQGGRVNSTKVQEYFKKAAKPGYTWAQYALGVHLLIHHGGEHDETTAR
tara:strand:- start:58 stop:255 length:198 start_codon:yes stop_codon:yes gene_type:complete